MKILTFSTLYPAATRPTHGIFVETRLRQLLATGKVESRVVAPVPWFPFSSPRFGEYAGFARTPREEHRHGIDVYHPRYVSVPKIGMSLAPFLLAAGAYPVVSNIRRRGYIFDIIDAHYFYPDGVAAAMIARRLDVPLVITARGTDINVLPQFALPRRLILWAIKQASALITVSAALKVALVKLGADVCKISVLRNGVDTHLFRPGDRESERARLGLTGKVLLTVGNLVSHKGHHIVIEAAREFQDAYLVVIGQGREERNLKQLAYSLGLQNRIRFVGAMPQERLIQYYAAADALVLASSREGWPNVLLEAMACGTPVVATRVGGTAEIIAAPEAGVLTTDGSARGIVEALQKLFRNYPNRELTRRYAERFGWEDTVYGQLEVFERVLAARGVD